MLKLVFGVCTAVAACVTHAMPEIAIGRTYEYLGANARTLLKRVSNTGSSTAFVRIEVLEIVFEEGEPIERPTPSLSLASGPQKAGIPGLVASPARLIIPVNSVQTTRLLVMGPRDVERYYRVRFVPVMPGEADAFALSDEERAEYAGSLSGVVTFLTGYGAILVVHPDTPRYDTRLHDEAHVYGVHNAGNTTIVMEGLKSCDASGNHCTDEIVRRVLPGKRINIRKHGDRHYRATLIEGDRRQTVTF